MKDCEGNILIKMKGNAKPKKNDANKRKKITESKIQTENISENGKEIKEIKSKIKENKLKPLMEPIQSDNSCLENLNIESNSLEDDEDLGISEELTEDHIVASKILERIELLKCKKAKKKLKKTDKNKNVKISKLKKTAIENDSMPMIEYKDEVIKDKSSTKNDKKNPAKSENVSELKSLKNTSTKTKNIDKSLNGNTSNHQTASNNGNFRFVIVIY